MPAVRRAYGSGALLKQTDKAGRTSYYGKWRGAGGVQVKRKLGAARAPGTADGLTKAQAEARLRELIAQSAEEARNAPAKPSGRTLGEVGETYIAARDLKSSTAQDYRMHLRAHLEPHFGDRSIDAIDADAIDELIGKLLARGLKVKTVRTYVTTLSTLLNYAVRKRWLKASPMGEVDLPPLRHDEEALRFLRPHEVNDLAGAARPGAYEVADRALYLTAVLTGLRQGELRGLTWSSIDLTAQRVTVVDNIVRGQHTSPKSRKVRSIPLAPQVLDELEALREASRWIRDHDPVFADPATGRPLARTPLMARYRKALTAAGLDPAFRFHDLRHTFGTTLAAEGVPEVTIQEWMGHADRKTTALYMHHRPSADDASRIGRAFALRDPRGTNRGTNMSADTAHEVT